MFQGHESEWNADWQAIHSMNSLSDKPLETIIRDQADCRTFVKIKDMLLKVYGMSTEDLGSKFLLARI